MRPGEGRAATPLRRRAARLGGALAALALSIVLLEALLQGVALALWVAGRPAPSGFLGGRHRVVCLGDSNTYGLYLPRESAWPGQLQSRWDASGLQPPIEVINLGFPGMNSSRILAMLPRLLDRLRPETAIVMVGANDFWTSAVPREAQRDERGLLHRLLAEHSRVFRLAVAVAAAVAEIRIEVDEPCNAPAGPRDPAFEGGAIRAANLDESSACLRSARIGGEAFELGWVREPGEAGVQYRLEDNLRELGAILEARGIRLVLLTYPARTPAYRVASDVARRVAGETGATLVDVTPLFEPHCPDDDCPELLFADHHPTERGYGVVAEAVAAALAP